MSFAVTSSVALNPWVQILAALEKKINRQSFDTWLKPTRFSHVRERMLFVRIPTPEFRHVGDRYADLIQEAIDNLGLEIDDVTFITPDEDPTLPRASAKTVDSRPSPSTPDSPAREWRASVLSSGGPPAVPLRLVDRLPAQPSLHLRRLRHRQRQPVRHGRRQAVAERPSKAYNPLFLYGGVGMGKTHLMHAIGHEVKRRQPHASICYVSGEKFTNEMINSVRYDKMTSFRDKFRNVDVLLIDDIQFLAGRSAPRRSSSTPSTRCTRA